MARRWEVIDVTIPAGGMYSDTIVVAGYAWATLHLTGTHDATKVLFKAIGKAGDPLAAALEDGVQAERLVSGACSVDVPPSALGYAMAIASDATGAITARLVPKD